MKLCLGAAAAVARLARAPRAPGGGLPPFAARSARGRGGALEVVRVGHELAALVLEHHLRDATERGPQRHPRHVRKRARDASPWRRAPSRPRASPGSRGCARADHWFAVT